MKTIRTQQSGRSMIEVIGYIAVIMTITMSIGHIISSAFGDYKFSKATVQLTDLANSITKAGAIEENYVGIINMIKGEGDGLTDFQKKEGLKMIPSSYRVRGRRIFHAFGGEVVIGIPRTEDVSGDASTFQNKFYILYYNLNRNQCIEMAMKDWMQNKYADLYAVIINGRSGAAWYWPAYTDMSRGSVVCIGKECTLPVRRSMVAGTSTDEDDGQCKDNNSNTIMWVFN